MFSLCTPWWRVSWFYEVPHPRDPTLAHRFHRYWSQSRPRHRHSLQIWNIAIFVRVSNMYNKIIYLMHRKHMLCTYVCIPVCLWHTVCMYHIITYLCYVQYVCTSLLCIHTAITAYILYTVYIPVCMMRFINHACYKHIMYYASLLFNYILCTYLYSSSFSTSANPPYVVL
jgi:hypothetical protein